MATPKQQQQASIAWFTSMIKGMRGSGKDRARVGVDFFSPARDPFLGGMFFFMYDAKHKETLPYWDKFPLVIPIEMYNDGFLGLNLHYLPPKLRRELIDKLVGYKKRAGNPRAYMSLSYPMLKGITRTKLFEPCLHRYLGSHMRSQLVKVHEDAWINATMLPVQRFQGATARQVWSQK